MNFIELFSAYKLITGWVHFGKQFKDSYEGFHPRIKFSQDDFIIYGNNAYVPLWDPGFIKFQQE